MSTEKMREEFQVWFSKNYPKINREETAQDCLFKMVAAQAWEKSRAAIEVELPDDGIEDCRKEWPERGEKYDYDTFDTGYLYSCKKHEEVIESLGLKVKS